MAGCRGFLNAKNEMRTSDEEKNITYSVDFILASITKPVLIENIFYDFDTYGLVAIIMLFTIIFLKRDTDDKRKRNL